MNKRIILYTLVLFTSFIYLAVDLVKAQDTNSNEMSNVKKEEKKEKRIVNTGVKDYNKIMEEFGVILILSIVFEVALTPIFNWNIYKRNFIEGSGMKTPITIILALLVFWKYDIDIIRDLLKALGYINVELSFGGRLITAFIIAGGSNGVYKIIQGLSKFKVNESKTQKDNKF